MAPGFFSFSKNAGRTQALGPFVLSRDQHSTLFLDHKTKGGGRSYVKLVPSPTGQSSILWGIVYTTFVG